MRASRAILQLAFLVAALPVWGVPPPSDPPTPPSDDPPIGSSILQFRDFVRERNTSCEALMRDCANATPQEIFDVSMYWPPSHFLGTCYAHDDTPAIVPFPYFARLYVKQTWRNGAKGYDGGTGAIGYPDQLSYADSVDEAGRVLKHLCETGQCCCPVLPAVEPCFPKSPVEAFDPRTGSCCLFPNRCTVPEGWEFDPAFGTHYRCL